MTIPLMFGLIRDTLKDDDDLLDLVDMRIYPEGEYNVDEVEFPCIVFEHDGGFYHEQSRSMAFDKITFFLYSQNSKKQCHEIYSHVKRLLKGHFLEDDNYNMNFRRSTRPKVKTDSNSKYKNFYFLTVSYEIIDVDKTQ